MELFSVASATSSSGFSIILPTFVFYKQTMNYSENILGTIGNTPLVKLNKVIKGIDALVLAKVETFNPGNSVKDRMAVKMIEDAEADGRLRCPRHEVTLCQLQIEAL